MKAVSRGMSIIGVERLAGRWDVILEVKLLT